MPLGKVQDKIDPAIVEIVVRGGGDDPRLSVSAIGGFDSVCTDRSFPIGGVEFARQGAAITNDFDSGLHDSGQNDLNVPQVANTLESFQVTERPGWDFRFTAPIRRLTFVAVL